MSSARQQRLAPRCERRPKDVAGARDHFRHCQPTMHFVCLLLGFPVTSEMPCQRGAFCNLRFGYAESNTDHIIFFCAESAFANIEKIFAG